MASAHFFLLTVLVASASCRQVYLRRDYSLPYLYSDDTDNVINDPEDSYIERHYEAVHPRVTRQLHGTMNTNPDGTANIHAKLPLAGNDQNVLSAIASGSGLKNGGGYNSASGGLQLENVNGHSLSVTKTHIPTFGDQLTAAGRVNLLNTEQHNLNANAFVTKNMPKFPGVPDFNTRGGGVDYTFNNKVGGSLGLSQTPFLQRTDVSAMSNLNLFRNPTSSLDFSAGATRSFSPFVPKIGWQPTFGLNFNKNF